MQLMQLLFCPKISCHAMIALPNIIIIHSYLEQPFAINYCFSSNMQFAGALRLVYFGEKKHILVQISFVTFLNSQNNKIVCLISSCSLLPLPPPRDSPDLSRLRGFTKKGLEIGTTIVLNTHHQIRRCVCDFPLKFYRTFSQH